MEIKKKTTRAREAQEAAAGRDGSCLPGLGPCLLEGLLLATLRLVEIRLLVLEPPGPLEAGT